MPVLVHAAHRTLGRALARRLLEEGGQVRATASDGVALLRAEGVFTAACDADDEGTLEAALTQVHTLVVLLGGLGRADADGVRQEGLAAARAAEGAGILPRSLRRSRTRLSGLVPRVRHVRVERASAAPAHTRQH